MGEPWAAGDTPRPASIQALHRVDVNEGTPEPDVEWWMRTVLHPRDLAGCEYRLALDSAAAREGAASPDAGPVADTPSVARRKTAAADHRERVRDMLADLHRDDPGAFRIIDPDAGRGERIAATRQACADGVRWIWGATLPTDRERGRRGDSELLVRVCHDGRTWAQDRPTSTGKPGTFRSSSSTIASPIRPAIRAAPDRTAQTRRS